ncbi:MAG: NADH-quinone oxidoreductase subunit NuoK [Elusimicrobia bacterium]|nr:NADH-quinone oxidoreductase subunit NuoK [Elusimicrobiota bacterium]
MTPSTIVWAVSGVMLLMGALCMTLRRQLLAMVLGVELMINAANVNIVYYAAQWKDPAGLAIALLVIAMAAAEVVVGFSLILRLNRIGVSADTGELRDLAG